MSVLLLLNWVKLLCVRFDKGHMTGPAFACFHHKSLHGVQPCVLWLKLHKAGCHCLAKHIKRGLCFKRGLPSSWRAAGSLPYA